MAAHFTRVREVLKGKEGELTHAIEEISKEALVKVSEAIRCCKVMQEVESRGRVQMGAKIDERVR